MIVECLFGYICRVYALAWIDNYQPICPLYEQRVVPGVAASQIDPIGDVDDMRWEESCGEVRQLGVGLNYLGLEGTS